MGMSQDEIGAQYEYSQPAISNFVRLLGLDDIVKAWINDETLSAGHGTALLSLPKEHQLSWAERAVKESIAVKPLEDLIRKWKAEEKRRLNPPIPDTADDDTDNPPAKDSKNDVTNAELDYVTGKKDSLDEDEKTDETPADDANSEGADEPVEESSTEPLVAVSATTATEVSGPPVVAMVPATESAWLKSVGLTAGVGLAHLRRFYGICQAAPNLGRVLEVDGLGGALDYLEKMHEPIADEDEGGEDEGGDNLALAEKHIIDLADAIHNCGIDGDEVHGPTVHGDLQYILHHVKAAQSERTAMLTACEIAEKNFRHYAEIHLKKGTSDGNRKAVANEQLASQMRDAIAKAKGETE